jgi:hypothetical protein
MERHGGELVGVDGGEEVVFERKGIVSGDVV